MKEYSIFFFSMALPYELFELSGMIECSTMNLKLYFVNMFQVYIWVYNYD